MTCSMKKLFSVALVGLLFFLSVSAPSWAVNCKPIGSITAIEGEVYVWHKGETHAPPAESGDLICLYDHIQTEKDSRVQILFDDESLLNLAENTTMQITEYVYSPEKRSSVFRLLVGKVRAIVGRYFPGAGSRCEIHTPTAIIGVRGTHFVVDATFTDETTVVCFDTSRDLAVRNIRDDVAGEVILTGGLMTKVLEGQPPTIPLKATEDLMMRLLRDTQVMLPALHGAPVELRGLLGKKKAAAAMAEVIREEGKMPPIPPAPDVPLFDAIRPSFARERLPEPPGPPPPIPPPK
jgi:hypothetical protein